MKRNLVPLGGVLFAVAFASSCVPAMPVSSGVVGVADESPSAGSWIGSGSIDESDFEQSAGVDIGDGTETPIPILYSLSATEAERAAAPPVATARQDANCRQGPSTDYPVVAHLGEGNSVTVVGRNGESSWLMLGLDKPSARCWIYIQLLTTTGDIHAVPIIVPPPPPTIPPTERPRVAPQAGCWIIDAKYPNGHCVARVCGPNDYPGISCVP